MSCGCLAVMTHHHRMQAERDALAARVTELEGLTTTQTQNENHLLRVRPVPFSFSTSCTDFFAQRVSC